MSKLLKQAKASLKLLEASRIGTDSFERAKARLKEVPSKIRTLAFASQEEVQDLRRRVELLEARLAEKENA
jgi:hypothetical protein